MIRKSYRQSSVHEYINITKQLPSTNPIRSPTPDLHSRRERIERTPSPNIVIDRSSLKNITNSHSKFNQNSKDFEKIIEAKDAKIKALQKELENLVRSVRNSNSNLKSSSDYKDRTNEETIEKLKNMLRNKDEENQDLKRKIEMTLQESNSPNDNKIREILLKFYQEINALKVENKQLNDRLESKRVSTSNYILEPVGSHTDPEKSKKAAVQHVQGGSVSPYHEPQPINHRPTSVSQYQESQPPYNNKQTIVIHESQPLSMANDQIPQLMSQLNEKDMKMRALAEELERLNEVLKLKTFENESFRERVSGNNQGLEESLRMKQLLQSKLQELDDLKSKLPKEDTEKLKALAAKTPILVEEIKDLNEVISRIRRENHENEEKIKVLAQEIERLTDMLKIHANSRQNDEKIVLLAQEIERLNELIKSLNLECQRLRPLESQLEALRRDHDTLQDKYNNKNKALESKLKELELLKEKCLLIDKAFTAEKEGLHERAEMLEKKANNLMAENQEISKIHRKSIVEKESHEQEVLRLQSMNQELAQEIKRLTETLKGKIHESEAKTQENDNLRQKLHEAESHKNSATNSHELERKKSQTIIQENDRKTLVIESLNQEINSLRNRVLELESKAFTQEREHEKAKKAHQDAISNLGTVQNQIEFINSKHQEKNQIYEAELRQKENDLREIRQKLMSLEQEKHAEIAKVRDSVSETQMRHEHEKRKTIGVMQEKESLQMECEVLRKERGDLQVKCGELKKALFQASGDGEQLKAKHDEYLTRVVVLSAINESVLNDLNDLRNENMDLGNRLQKVLTEKSLEEIKLRESLNETKVHHEREKRKSFQVVAEKESLNKTLEMIAKDKEDLHKRLYDTEVKNIEYQGQLRNLTAKYEEALIRVTVMSCELERLLEMLDGEGNMKRMEIEEMRKENESKLKGMNERKRKEIDELKAEFDNESKRLVNMIKNLEEQNEGLVRKHANDRSDFIAKYEKAMKETISKNINDMNASHQQELDQVQVRISEHQKLADKYKQELEKMASIMSEKHEEVANWREKVQKLEQQRILELEELKKHLELLKSSYVNNPPGLEFQAERLAYETNINQLKSRISSLESALREKNSKQENILKEYESKNIELKTKIRGYESSKENELIGLKEMNDRLKKQFEETREKLSRSESEARRLELEAKQMQIAIGAIRSELEQTQKSLEIERLENSRLASKMKDTEILYRSRGDEGKEEKIETMKELEIQILEITKSRDEFVEKSEKNERALTEMNGVLIGKIQELERLKSQYHESINKVHLLESKLLEKLQEDEVYIS